MDTDDVMTCEKCGILLDKTVVLKQSEPGYGFGTHTYVGNCPVCKKEIRKEE